MQSIALIIEPDPDDPDCADVTADGTVAGRPHRFVVDTGAARTQLVADDLTPKPPTRGGPGSAGVFAAGDDVLVTVSNLVVGPMSVDSLDVTLIAADRPGARNLLGMDVLRHHACHFRFDSATLVLAGPSPAAAQALLPLETDDAGHGFVELTWPGATARACWDSGAGITVVDQSFLLRNPDLFTEIGSSVGTDSTGAQAETPTLLMAGPRIGGELFAPHKIAVVDLSPINATLDQPMDLILGYTTLRQADWLVDFPAGRWAVTRPPLSGP